MLADWRGRYSRAYDGRLEELRLTPTLPTSFARHSRNQASQACFLTIAHLPPRPLRILWLSLWLRPTSFAVKQSWDVRVRSQESEGGEEDEEEVRSGFLVRLGMTRTEVRSQKSGVRRRGGKPRRSRPNSRFLGQKSSARNDKDRSRFLVRLGMTRAGVDSSSKTFLPQISADQH